MEPVLTNRMEVNDVYIKQTMPVRLRGSYFFTAMLVAAYLAVTLRFAVAELQTPGAVPWSLILTVAVPLIMVLYQVHSTRKAIRRQCALVRETAGAESYTIVSHFTEEGVNRRSSYDEQTLNQVPYRDIRRIQCAKGYIFLGTLDRTAYALDTKGFEAGSEADFWQLMNEKCPKAVPKKHRVAAGG